MLSNEAKIIHDILLEISGDGEVYKIVDADEILEKLPGDISLTKVQLSHIIRDLRDKDYISVKYFTPDEYCLLAFKKAETPQKPEVSQDKGERAHYDKRKTEQSKPAVKAKSSTVFLMAFLGALAGSAVVAVIAILVIKLV